VGPEERLGAEQGHRSASGRSADHDGMSCGGILADPVPGEEEALRLQPLVDPNSVAHRREVARRADERRGRRSFGDRGIRVVLDGYGDVKVGDVLELFKTKQVEKTLE
jgi:hypothetical protein